MLNIFLIIVFAFLCGLVISYRCSSIKYKKSIIGWQKVYFDLVSKIIEKVFEDNDINVNYTIIIRNNGNVVIKIGEIDNQVEVPICEFLENLPAVIDKIKNEL